MTRLVRIIPIVLILLGCGTDHVIIRNPVVLPSNEVPATAPKKSDIMLPPPAIPSEIQPPPSIKYGLEYPAIYRESVYDKDNVKINDMERHINEDGTETIIVLDKDGKSTDRFFIKNRKRIN